jgi:hypothetical protein
MNDQRHCVALFQPWERIDAVDRLTALEVADEIIFSDKSVVVRHGFGWMPDYSRMKSFVVEPQAVKFIRSLHAVAAFASRRWVK